MMKPPKEYQNNLNIEIINLYILNLNFLTLGQEEYV